MEVDCNSKTFGERFQVLCCKNRWSLSENSLDIFLLAFQEPGSQLGEVGGGVLWSPGGPVSCRRAAEPKPFFYLVGARKKC